MKKIFANTILIFGLLALLFINACKDVDPIIEELNYDRAFTPRAFKAQISSITTLTLTWAEVKNVDHYVVEIYQGTEFVAGNLIATIDTLTTTYAYTLPAGDTQFSARIKTVSSIEGVDDSKWTSVSFVSGKENLFTSYNLIMTGIGNITVNWTPGKTVTHLAFIKNSVETQYAITAGEAAAGSKNLTGVPNGGYEIKIMNGEFSRGKQNYVIEGDAVLASGGDLKTAIKALGSGQVLLVESGTFGFVAQDTIKKNIKIRGMNPTSLPTIYPAAGASNTNGMFMIAATATDSIVFQNVKLTGYINNDGGTSGVVTGVFDQGTATACACAITKVKFDGCILEHQGRHVIRLRGTVTQSITNFEINNCIISDFGSNNAGYGIINANNATASIANIKITNSTIYNTQCGLLVYGASLGCQSVVIDNCTCDQTMLAATRYLVDFGTSATSSAGTVNISDCIFGTTNAGANGVRQNLMTLSISGSYYTSGFVNAANSITSSMTSYPGASSALWTNPTGGVFTFLDQNFAGKNSAGDPRWKP